MAYSQSKISTNHGVFSNSDVTDDAEIMRGSSKAVSYTHLHIEDLTVRFKNSVTAIDHADLDIPNGIFGLLGENGAGKTTLMRVLTTVLKDVYKRQVIAQNKCSVISH